MVQKQLRKLAQADDTVIANHARGILVRLATQETCAVCELAECICEKKE